MLIDDFHIILSLMTMKEYLNQTGGFLMQVPVRDSWGDMRQEVGRRVRVVDPGANHSARPESGLWHTILFLLHELQNTSTLSKYLISQHGLLLQ